MNYRLMFTANAIVVAIFGALFLILPDYTLTKFGVEEYVATLLVTRFFGGSLLIIAVLLWFVKEISDQQTERKAAIGMLVASVTGVILTLIGVASSSAVIRENGWILLVLFILFSLGYGFLLSGISIVTKK